MLYCRIENGTVTSGPGNPPKALVVDDVVYTSTPDDATLAKAGWVPVEVVDNRVSPGGLYRVIGEEMTYDPGSGVVTRQYTTEYIGDYEAWAWVRHIRGVKLAECDWTMLPDAPVANSQEWKNYRQALRDVPQSNTDPREVQWPTPPTE